MQTNYRLLISRNKREGRYAGFRQLLRRDKHQRTGSNAEPGLFSLKEIHQKCKVGK